MIYSITLEYGVHPQYLLYLALSGYDYRRSAKGFQPVLGDGDALLVGGTGVAALDGNIGRVAPDCFHLSVYFIRLGGARAVELAPVEAPQRLPQFDRGVYTARDGGSTLLIKVGSDDACCAQFKQARA